MDESEDLLSVAAAADAALGRLNEQTNKQQIDRLKVASAEVAKAWCGSNIGYHATVYWADLKSKPPHAQFSAEWGLKETWPVHEPDKGWTVCNDDAVINEVFRRAECSNSDAISLLFQETRKQFLALKETALSSLLTSVGVPGDPYLKRKLEQVQKLDAYEPAKVLRALLPTGQIWSRDSLAITQGVRTAPHQHVEAIVVAGNSVQTALEGLAKACREGASHMVRMRSRKMKAGLIGTNVFLGHGRNHQWREVKDFIQEKLGLPVDEFNSRPIAGISTQVRLSELLDAAAFAFLVMTGEDETVDGKYIARMNVVHEVGLFQGRLGFSRAIVLLEDGCEEFSNISGLGQIRFPKGNVRAVFEDIRAVLEREELLGA